jgi:hypothetical protein
MVEKEVPVGCKPILSKLSEDLKDDADRAIIAEDVENFQKCLKANNSDK